MKDTITLNMMNLDDCSIFYNYKVGSRFVQSFFEEPKKEYSISYFISHNFTDIQPPDFNTSLISEKVLMLYRDPFQKMLSGLIEDFQEHVLRVNNLDKNRIRNFLKHSGDYEFNIKQLYFLNEIIDEIDTYNTRFTHEKLVNVEFGNVTALEAYCNLVFRYIKWRLETFQLDEGHSSHNNLACYIILNQWLKDKDVTLFNLDDDSIKLSSFLKTYSKHKIIFESKKEDFSNQIIKDKIEDRVKNELDNIIQHMMGYEYMAYNIIKRDIRNISNQQEKNKGPLL